MNDDKRWGGGLKAESAYDGCLAAVKLLMQSPATSGSVHPRLPQVVHMW